MEWFEELTASHAKGLDGDLAALASGALLGPTVRRPAASGPSSRPSRSSPGVKPVAAMTWSVSTVSV
ncbi:hypothetical protein PUR57_00255, partial [Streptomyces sp. JV176]|uniref:hypothetical protein n=1 Tax=Streptomyces sp. JV176 TaxID=858630 RepID=UPI002E792D7A